MSIDLSASDPQDFNTLLPPPFPPSIHASVRRLINSRVELVHQHQIDYFDDHNSTGKPMPRHESASQKIKPPLAKQNIYDLYSSIKSKELSNITDEQYYPQRTHSIVRSQRRSGEDIDAWVNRSAFRALQKTNKKNLKIIELYRIRSVIMKRRLKKWAKQTEPLDTQKVREFNYQLKTGFPLKEDRQWRRASSTGSKHTASAFDNESVEHHDLDHGLGFYPLAKLRKHILLPPIELPFDQLIRKAKLDNTLLHLTTPPLTTLPTLSTSSDSTSSSRYDSHVD